MMENNIATKDKIDAFLRLLSSQHIGFERRCNVEWKMTAILWAAIFATTGFLKINKISISLESVLWFSIIFFIIYFVWIGRLGRAHRIDKDFKLFYQNQVEKLLGVSKWNVDHPKDPKLRFPIHLDLWLWLEILFTLLFLVASLSFLIIQGIAY